MSVDRVSRSTAAGEFINLRSPHASGVAIRTLPLLFLPALVTALILAFGVSSASAAGTVAWTIRGVPEPTRFSANDATRCEKSHENCDRYQLLTANVSDVPSSGTITVTDKLPPGITTAKSPESSEEWWSCTEGRGNTEVTCTSEHPVAAGQFAPEITVYVTAPATSAAGSGLKNEASITGGGTGAVVSTSEETLDSSQAPPFGLSEFSVEATAADGSGSMGAGAHPWEVSANLELPTVEVAPEALHYGTFSPVELWKSAAVELPLGLIGDPLATPRCTESELESRSGCPADSGVGSVDVGTEITGDSFAFSNETGALTTPLYNMVPEGGDPGEFGVTVSGVSLYFYASVVHTPSGYRLRVADPGIPAGGIGAFGGVFTFYGEPAKVAGGSSDAAFLSNPTRCSTEPQTAKGEVESWEKPGHPVSREATLYPELSGCDLLQAQFHLVVSMVPSEAGSGPGQEGSSQADEPSAYSFDLKSPQGEAFDESATPEIRDVTVTLPEGVSISPSAGDGLVACPAKGPEGIDIPTGVNGAGEPLHDNEAGEGEEIGADGLSHLAEGHCPKASRLGTVDVFTPDLPTRCGGEGQAACKEPDEAAPLQGHVYLAQPECGDEGQPECTSAYAEGHGGPSGEGKLFGLYIEVEGSGVVIKLPGYVTANRLTGQLQATFRENPQFPFSELDLHMHGGPRAPLANPQTCGSYTTTSTLSSWAGQEVAGEAPSFKIDWDGQGGACPASLPFGPGFLAGSIAPTAGGFSPLSVAFSRHDREQDLSAIIVHLPPGVAAILAQVPLCGEAQANAGSCGEASLIGHTHVAVGSGSSPYWVEGKVYLTGPYNGAPFGLSVVTPAKAGPFNLGNVIVRAAIHIDPNTAAVTAVSNPLPQVIDGVPLRIQTVNVTLDRPNFAFNPTNCSQQSITATITSTQGTSASVSSPFAVAGCAKLPFKPSFKLSTQGKTSRVNGASLVVKISQRPGEANIHKVHLAFPKSLPARLSSLRGACTEAQFAANPSGCPAGSVIGTGTAVTPVLSAPLSGPAYLVSHGGAAYPDVVFVLQGDGVTIDLTGATDIKKGIAYSTFETVPDAPVSSFEAVLPEGPHAVFGANLPGKAKGSFCGRAPTVATTLEGQNAAVLVQKTRATVSNCPKKKPKHKTKKARRRKKK